MKNLLEATAFLPVYEAPKEIAENFFARLEEMEKAREEVFRYLQELGLEAKSVEPDLTIRLKTSNSKVLDQKLFRQVNPSCVVPNRRTKKGKEVAEKLESLLQKAYFSPNNFLWPYVDFSRGGRFGSLAVHWDQDRKRVFYCGVFGVDKKKLEEAGWVRCRVFIETP